METIKTVARGGDCEEREEFSLPGVKPRSFIDVVEAGEFPAAFGQFEYEAYRCVFLVVWRLLERAVNVVMLGGLLMRFGPSKTLRGIGVSFENFVITAQELLFVLYGFAFVAHR